MTAKKALSLSVSKEVQDLMNSLNSGDMEKNARAFGKGISADVKLNRFLTADFSKGPQVFNEANIDKILDTVNAYGFTDVDKKKAQLASIFAGSIDSAVTAKRLKVTANGKLNLDDDQKDALAAKLAQYGNYLRNQILPGATVWAQTFGLIEGSIEKGEIAVLTPVEEPAQVPAQEPVLEPAEEVVTE